MTNTETTTETLLIKIAREYLNLPLEHADQAIQSSLQEMATFVGADRAYIFRYDLDVMQTSNTYEWCAEGISAEIDNLQNVDVSFIPDWLSAHERGEELYIPDVFALPRNSGIREILEPQGVKSIITVPMRDHGKLLGFIGFDSVREYHVYTDKERKLLALYAEMLVNIGARESAFNKILEERERAERANKAKSEFLANMSHEIRTPLNAVIGYCDLLTATTLDAQQNEFVNTIQYSSNLLLGIVNDILDFSKIEAGKLALEQKPVSLSAIAEHLFSMFAEKAAKKNVALNVLLDVGEHDWVFTDELRFTQVLMNLTNNALKFTYTGSIQIVIRCTQTHRRFADYYIAVEDTGIGMDSELVDRLFQPFEQADNSTSRKFGGTGLGLAISQRIINAFGSKLEVISEPGLGSQFYTNLTFKLASAIDATDTAEKNTKVRVPNLQKFSILVAEDVKVNRDLLQHLFSPTGCALTFAENGQEAVDAALTDDFDLIIMDLQMPILDGFAASMRITASKPNTKIIALSAASSELDIQRSAASGIRIHLAKPIRRVELYRIVQKLLIGTAEN
ncbi:ATP-binding protein [Aliidiomarina sp.]|uniref:GAF domain-containing hybrid sensor histidine kinase/response regulator n=1 Tax=Aliidiomarina sp. TaxID=1872439 RepID=UPI003A4D3F63